MSEQQAPQGADEEYYFVENMARWREEKGWSQSDLAREVAKLGWTAFRQTTISRIEKHERPVRLGEAQGIARALSRTMANMIKPPIEMNLIIAMRRARNGSMAAERSLREAIEKYLTALKHFDNTAQQLRAAADEIASKGVADQDNQLKIALEVERRPDSRTGRDRVQSIVDRFIDEYGEDPELVTDSAELREKFGIGRDGRGVDPEAS